MDSLKAKHKFQAKLIQLDNKKVEQFTITSKENHESIVGKLLLESAGKTKVTRIEKKQRTRNPAPPFTTSTLQQEIPTLLSPWFYKEIFMAPSREVNPKQRADRCGGDGGRQPCFFKENWLGRQDSNLRMPVPKTGALPLGDTPAAQARSARESGLIAFKNLLAISALA